MQELIDAINEAPSDFQAREVYADWLEQHGDETAEGWRWLNAEKKIPEFYEDYNDVPYTWFLGRNTTTEEFLPEPVFHVMVNPSVKDPGWADYATPFIALEAAALAVVESGILNESKEQKPNLWAET